MSRFQKIAEGFDATDTLLELAAQPELWDRHLERRRSDTSPHRETQDIWCRYRAPGEKHDWHQPFRSVWYPCWQSLRSLWPLYHPLAETVKATDCGGVLITRIPPGCWVYPHHDRGTWHSEHYTTKIWTILKANPRCINYSVDQDVIMKPGESWSYDNLEPHAVHNGGDDDRLCLITCFRCDNA